MKINVTVAATVAFALAPFAHATPPKDEAGRTQCKAYAMVLQSSAIDQKKVLDMAAQFNPTPSERDRTRLARDQARYEETLKLASSLDSTFGKAAAPTPEAVKAAGSLPSAQLRDSAQACL